MREQTESHWLPWTAEQMFDLAADIERYPEFLPHWPQASIRARAGNVVHVHQKIDLGVRYLHFESRAVLQRPDQLRVDSTSGPFRRLSIDWRFTPERSGCRTTLKVEMEMRSLLLEALAGRLMEMLTRDVLARFRDRAATLY